jgi:hypothetical protein
MTKRPAQTFTTVVYLVEIAIHCVQLMFFAKFSVVEIDFLGENIWGVLFKICKSGRSPAK